MCVCILIDGVVYGLIESTTRTRKWFVPLSPNWFNSFNVITLTRWGKEREWGGRSPSFFVSTNTHTHMRDLFLFILFFTFFSFFFWFSFRLTTHSRISNETKEKKCSDLTWNDSIIHHLPWWPFEIKKGVFRVQQIVSLTLYYWWWKSFISSRKIRYPKRVK